MLLHAWSVRFIVLAGLLSAAEVGLPIINDAWAVPPLLYLFLLTVATAGGVVARVIVQQGITPAPAPPASSEADLEADRADQ